jgi:hypothetical protein
MFMNKKLLAPERLRQLPSQFSWIDQQLVRGGHLRDCDHSAWALYLFLATVADSQGLSYYSDASVCQWLQVDRARLPAIRQQLITAGLLAYQKPLYQLLALPKPAVLPAAPRTGQVRSVGELLRQIAGGAA